MGSAIEIWRPVVGYEGLYEVSSIGNVRSCERVRRQWNGRRWCERVLPARPMKVVTVDGYPRVGLRDGKRQRLRSIHILVCEAFLGPRPQGMQASHSDGNATNSQASNLRWATPIENMADRDRHGRTVRGEVHHDRRLCEKDVRDIRVSSLKTCELARQFGVSWTAIDRVRKRRTWKHVN